MARAYLGKMNLPPSLFVGIAPPQRAGGRGDGEAELRRVPGEHDRGGTFRLREGRVHRRGHGVSREYRPLGTTKSRPVSLR